MSDPRYVKTTGTQCWIRFRDQQWVPAEGPRYAERVEQGYVTHIITTTLHGVRLRLMVLP